MYFHPRYNPKNLRHNICLLRLTRRLKFRRRSRKVKKIDIDRTHSGLPMTTNGITVVGWGAQDVSRIKQNILSSFSSLHCSRYLGREWLEVKNRTLYGMGQGCERVLQSQLLFCKMFDWVLRHKVFMIDKVYYDERLRWTIFEIPLSHAHARFIYLDQSHSAGDRVGWSKTANYIRPCVWQR